MGVIVIVIVMGVIILIIVLNSKFEGQADPEEPGSDIEEGWQ